MGIGVVEEPPFDLDSVAVDVRWPSGRCFENLDQLVHAPTELELNVLDSIADDYESVRTISADLRRDYGSEYTDRAVSDALKALAIIGYADAYIYQKESNSFVVVSPERFSSVEEVWFFINKAGRCCADIDART